MTIQQASKIAADDIWLSIRKFKGKPDQVNFVCWA